MVKAKVLGGRAAGGAAVATILWKNFGGFIGDTIFFAYNKRVETGGSAGVRRQVE